MALHVLRRGEDKLLIHLYEVKEMRKKEDHERRGRKK